MDVLLVTTRISFFASFPNKMSEREVKKLIVLCVNSEEGCEWKDELGKLEDHVAICEMHGVGCPLKCETTLKRANLDNHCKNECPCRQTNCKHCHITVRVSCDHETTQGPVFQATTELPQ